MSIVMFANGVAKTKEERAADREKRKERREKRKEKLEEDERNTNRYSMSKKRKKGWFLVVIGVISGIAMLVSLIVALIGASIAWPVMGLFAAIAIGFMVVGAVNIIQSKKMWSRVHDAKPSSK
ncbi:MAG: DUF2244 domain-containing protein [Aureispira sp.]|nr:DUF2244 domain-containing protein [Aureispira sp.]